VLLMPVLVLLALLGLLLRACSPPPGRVPPAALQHPAP
jgi:hypothetical protein